MGGAAVVVVAKRGRREGRVVCGSMYAARAAKLSCVDVSCFRRGVAAAASSGQRPNVRHPSEERDGTSGREDANALPVVLCFCSSVLTSTLIHFATCLSSLPFSPPRPPSMVRPSPLSHPPPSTLH